MLSSSLLLPHLWNFLLPLPAPDRISRFRVSFHFQSFSSKCFRFHKILTASTSLLSMKQLIVFSVKKTGKFTLLAILFDLCWRQGMVGNEMEDDFSIFRTGNFLPFYFHSMLKIFHSIFHPVLKFSSILRSIPKHFRLEAMQRIFYCFASLQYYKQPLVKVRRQY